jgi:hypothetical protein
MKTRHCENENSNCFRVVPANFFLVLCSFIAIIKLALSSSYADPELLVPFHAWRYSPRLDPSLPQKTPPFFSLSTSLHHPYIPRICHVTLLTMSSIPPRVFPLEFSYEELLASNSFLGEFSL